MSTDYAGFARKIIRDAIVSSIYIDDEIVEPFSPAREGKQSFYDISKGLYESFRKESKSIDFYKYNRKNGWEQDKDYLFKNRDLLILDWQLNSETEIRQEETLKILKEAVATESLHFVSIYTETPEKQFDDIFYLIKAYFTGEYSAQAKTGYAAMKESLDNEGLDTKFFSELGGDFKVLTLAAAEKKPELLELLKKNVLVKLGKSYKIFSNFLKSIHSETSVACDIVGFCINEELCGNPGRKDIQVNMDFLEKRFIVLNNTIIQLTNKKTQTPGDLFNFFTEAVQGVCGNILTLISLEIRSLLRESSGFIGKDINNITDAILFHQKEKKDQFLDFLIGILRNQTSSYFDYKYGRLAAMKEEFWTGYKKEKKVEALTEGDARINQELTKLNVYYNEFHIKKNKEDTLKIGDVFEHEGKFFLCITAHCDCLNPRENIKNNFYFVMGERYSTDDALQDGDGGYYSYINFKGEDIVVRWNNRPTVFKISEYKISNLKATDGLDAIYNLNYVTTLKENYAQRMANNSFPFAMRVGIDFGSVK